MHTLMYLRMLNARAKQAFKRTKIHFKGVIRTVYYQSTSYKIMVVCTHPYVGCKEIHIVVFSLIHSQLNSVLFWSDYIRERYIFP